MALSRVELNVHPYGLGGGTVVSGSATLAFTDVFQYYPITTTNATLKITMPITGSFANAATSSIGNTAWPVGVPVYGPITEVTQSSGLAIVYKGVVTADGGYRL